jgi:hypothetical protein
MLRKLTVAQAILPAAPAILPAFSDSATIVGLKEHTQGEYSNVQ